MSQHSLDAINSALKLGDCPVFPYGVEFVWGAFRGMVLGHNIEEGLYRVMWVDLIPQAQWEPWVLAAGVGSNGDGWLEVKRRDGGVGLVEVEEGFSMAVFKDKPPKIIWVPQDKPFAEWFRYGD